MFNKKNTNVHQKLVWALVG